MCTQTITSAWQNILNHFFGVFTTPTANIFKALVCGWILYTARRTVTGIVPFATCFFQRPHDAFHRFFNNARWSLCQLWQTLAVLLVKMLCPGGNINLNVDDTLFRRQGKHVDGASKRRDPVLSDIFTAFLRGLNLVVVTLRVYPPWKSGPISLPINMRLHPKNGPSHTGSAQQMLCKIASWMPRQNLQIRFTRMLILYFVNP